ncbi:hypothetical protein OPQ81_011363 [Rhizoctonia solani]|nr:hypothetical protein OPQ81_011363 [Rhizoctonia solani]
MATTTTTTTTTTVPNKMFNSVELVLMLLSMYSCVTKDIRTTVMFLLEIVFGYEPLTRKFGRKPKVHEVRTLFEPLSALAQFHSAEFTLEDIQNETGALAMVSEILKPILTRLSLAEFAEIHKKADDAVEIMINTPLSELQALVAKWASDARSDAKFHSWLEWARIYLHPGQTDFKPVDVSKAGEIVAQYLYGDSAAALATCSLRRTDRVEKRQGEDPLPTGPLPPKHRPNKHPLPPQPCPVYIIVTSPTALDLSSSCTSLASLGMDQQPFTPSHRGVRRTPGDWIEHGALDTFKYPLKSSDTMREPTELLHSSDNRSITIHSDITHTTEQTLAIPISRTYPNLSTSVSTSALERCQGGSQVTYSSWRRSPSEIVVPRTTRSLSCFRSGEVGCPNWSPFSISSRLSESRDADISGRSPPTKRLEHKDDSLITPQRESVANLSGMSYESSRFPQLESRNASPNASNSTSSTRTSPTAITSVESLFSGWAVDWESGQLCGRESAISEHDACESHQQTLVAQYTEWAMEWQTMELESWSSALINCEMDVCLDTKNQRLEVRQAADNPVVQFAKKVGRVFGF